MILKKKLFKVFLFVFIGFSIFGSRAALAGSNVTLYTPYTKVSVPPGESVNYSIDVINDTKELQNSEITISGMPRGWTYTLNSGGYTVSQIAVLPGEKKGITLKVDVPYQVNKGSYRFKIMAGDSSELPIIINVSEKGTYETEFTTDQPNMQGPSSSTFTFKTELKNRTADQQLYALIAEATRGWNVVFKADYKQVTSVEMVANTTKEITVEINPPAQIEAGTYMIPVRAETKTTSSKVQLEVVITGSFNMELTTPTGLLSTEVTAGDEKRLELIVRNTGSSLLSGIDLSSSIPSNWSVVFDPKKIDKILPGNEATVFATIKADKKAIPGDYVINMESKTPEATSKAAFRISVKTSMLWGWVGILIILFALGSVYYLFGKYGRR